MATLYGRRWRLEVGAGGKRVEVTSLRTTFSIERHHKPEPGRAVIEVYNLGPDSRSRLSQDFERELGAGFVRDVQATLEAGYEHAFPLIFRGKIARVWHRRDGPDWVTTLEADDGARELATKRVRISFTEGTRVTDVFRSVASQLGLGLGNALKMFQEGNFSRSISQFAEGLVLSGSSRDVLEQLARSAGLEYSVQNEQLVFTRSGEPLAGQVVELSRDTGLVGAPEPGEQGLVRCRALIRPGLEPARRVHLQSASVDGFYRCASVTYTGDSHGVDWYADLDLQRV